MGSIRIQETTLRKHGILDRFDTLSYFDHNSLVLTPIEVIQISMERKEEELQISRFEVFKIQASSR